MIAFTGLGSGLDVDGLVSGLVAAEGSVKTQQLTDKRSGIEAEVSAYGALKGVMSVFQTAVDNLKEADSFAVSTATSSDTSVFTASTSGSVATGNYSIEIIDIAEAQKLLSGGFTDSATNVGTGTLTISVGSDSFNVLIDSSNQTLAGIRDAINAASDNTGVSATIINVDDGMGGTESKLVFTSDDTGIDNKLTILVDDDDLADKDASGLSQLFYQEGDLSNQLSEINPAVDADIRIDGQQITSSSNTITGAVEGLTLNLLSEDPGNVKDLSIAIDKAAISSQIDLFVSNYNSFVSLSNSLGDYNAETGVGGILLGDGLLRSATFQIRQQLTDTVSGLGDSVQSLVDIGITTEAGGTLTLDTSKLDSVLDSNLSDVSELFSGSDGLATNLGSILDEYLKSDGILDGKTEGLNSSIAGINDDLVSLEESLDKLETRLLSQFNALDGLLAQLQNTSNFLSQTLATIPTIGSNNSN